MSTNTPKRGPGGAQPGAGGTVGNVRLTKANRDGLREAIGKEAYGKAVVAERLAMRKG